MLARIKRLLIMCVPPIIPRIGFVLHNMIRPPILEYAPNGWDTELDIGEGGGWSVDSAVEAERIKFDQFCRNLDGTGPLGFSHEHDDLSLTDNASFQNVHLSYAYVLGLAAHGASRVTVLDYGGGLGHYYQIGKAVLPDVDIDFHVKEVPMMAATGKALNPDVHFSDDDSCLDRQYDLVMMTGSIPYIRNWTETVPRIAASAGKYFFAFRFPVVTDGPSWVAVQRIYGSRMLQQVLNQDEFLRVMETTGLTLVREFVTGDRPFVKGAPEQCEIKGWLFKRTQSDERRTESARETLQSQLLS